MKCLRIILMTALTSLLLAPSPQADTIRVPNDQPTIQAGIFAAQVGDTVLVSEGNYYENIDFIGKDIVVCSEYALDQDLDHILNTVIDGSTSAEPDSGSCVVFVSGESRAAVLQGFTLTGGTGTSYYFNPAGPPYREGGAVIVSYSDPTICNNRITGNSAPAGGAALPGGGGGISAMRANPLIRNNVIFKNIASYAAGMVLNYSAGEVRNNIIFGNSGGGQFGTGGLMVYASPPDSAIIENNAIVGNISETDTGGLSVAGTSAIIRNNIIWGNRQASGFQVVGIGTSTFEYCFTEEYYTGQGNQTLYPDFMPMGFLLSAASPCIDSGSPASEYNDAEDPGSPGSALFPAQGFLRSDVGCYGGPFAMELPAQGLEGDFELQTALLDFGTIDEGESVALPIVFKSFSGVRIQVLQVEAVYQEGEGVSPDQSLPFDIEPLDTPSLTMTWQPGSAGPLAGTLAIYHDCAAVAENPLLIPFGGMANQVTAVGDPSAPILKLENFPNPFNPSTTILFSLPAKGMILLDVFDLQGRLVKSLVAGEMPAGAHSVVWNGFDNAGRAKASGVYFYRLRTPNVSLQRRMVLIK